MEVPGHESGENRTDSIDGSRFPPGASVEENHLRRWDSECWNMKLKVGGQASAGETSHDAR